MAAYLGIPIRIKTPDAAGDLTQFETAVFATVTRHPAMADLLQSIARASVEEDAALRLSMLAQRAVLDAATPGDVAVAKATALAAAEAAETATQEYAAAVRSFIVGGFRLAGYTDEQAERYAELAGSNRLAELKGACLVGVGRLDFTTAPAR